MIRNPFRDIDAKNLRRSSDILKKPNDYQKIVNKRLQIVMLVIIILFSGIGIRLMDIQIRKHDAYSTKLANYTLKKQTTSTPRGQMYDRKGRLIVTTIPSMNITYFPPSGVSSSDQWELAMKFAKQFEVSFDHLKTRDLQDAYISLHENENGSNDYANHVLSKEELSLSDDEIYKIKLERITPEMIDAFIDDDMKAAWVVYSAMEVNSQNSHARVVLEDVDEEKVAYLTEHKADFRGFDIDFSSWKREYPYGSTFKDVLGQVTTSQQGLPAELSQYYLAKGYENNARVGRSGLEQQYEDLLAGTPKVSTIKYDEDGNAIFTESNPGKKGYDLQLTVDIELQKTIDDILKATLEKYKDSSSRPDMNNLFVTLSDPNTGEIFAMSGQQRYEDGVIDYASGNYITDYTPGSIIKGATVYMGLNEGVITSDETINDAPMYIQGTPAIASYANYGPVNAVKALQVSSNIYMVHIAMRLAGTSYVPNGPLVVDDPGKTYNLMRSYYSMFGLGVLTGLDVPNENLGFQGSANTAGQLLYFSFGQYDNYTPIQILQYASTIATGGQKIRPRLVSGAYGVNADSLVFTNETEVMSTVYGNSDYLNVVSEGFRACVTSNYCGSGINALPHNVAAKTGTAEVFFEGHNSTNASLIGFAPYDDPEVSFVCAAPTSANVVNPLPENICSSEIMPAVLKAYYDSK